MGHRFWRGADACGREQVPFAPSSNVLSDNSKSSSALGIEASDVARIASGATSGREYCEACNTKSSYRNARVTLHVVVECQVREGAGGGVAMGKAIGGRMARAEVSQL